MVLFGTSGVSDSMKNEKLTYTEIAERMKNMGLLCFEYPFTYGTNITEEKCTEIGKIFNNAGIKLSIHAPYYINLASPNEEQILKSFGYIYESMRKAKIMGADRVVFHPGSLTGQTREVAYSNVYNNTKAFIEKIKDDESVSGVYICPETMGKHGQIGTSDEIQKLCEIDDCIIPTLDFGHINAFTGGELNSVDKFCKIFDMFVNTKNEIHIHFSRIEYGAKGEIKHLTFDNDPSGFGPEQTIFIEALKKYSQNIRVICESSGTQAEDSKIMLDIFKK